MGLLLAFSGVGLETAAADPGPTRSRLAVSLTPDRASAVNLNRARLHGLVYVHVRDSANLRRVEFYVDNPWGRKRPVQIENHRPFDLAGTAADGSARPFDTRTLKDGRHFGRARLHWTNGRTSTRWALFVVDNVTKKPTPPPTSEPPTGTPTAETPTTEPTETPTTEPTETPTTEPSETPTTTPTTSTPPVSPGSWPSAPPAKICGNASILNGPANAPAGAVLVPAGDNSSLNLNRAGVTYWFAPGVHTLGSDVYAQIIPGDNSTYIGAPGAIIDGKQRNRYAFTQRARDVTIKYLTVRNFVSPNDEGTVNHDAGEGWTMQYLTVEDNGGAGIFVGPGNVASFNCLRNNSQYGFQGISLDGGGSDLVLDHNEISGNNTGDWENRIPGGCGCTGGGKFWDVRNVKVTNNWVHDNKGTGLWADTNNNNFLFEGNWIEDNDGQAIFWETSYNAAIRNNVMRHNLLETGPRRIKSGDNFPDAAVYISESGGDARVPFDLVGSPTIDIAHNLIEDNYNGVTLWENADRYCGSPANTSTGYCTLVNPSVAKISTCTAKNIDKAPYYSDCRWKTQNVKVHHNSFKMDRGNFSNCAENMCGRNAIFSNYGSSPSWSPYKNEVICKAITFSQGNVFSDNTYTGTWNFTTHDASGLVSWSGWRAAPFGQDGGSALTG
jgi:Right handed beta helix region